MRKTEISDGELLLYEIELLPIDAWSKSCILDLLRTVAGKRVYLPQVALKRQMGVKVARRLLDAGEDASTVRDRLVSGGHCNSQRVAYRIICKAVNERGAELALARGF